MKEKHKRVLWLVVARSGSKGIPDKNIKMLGKHPLLTYRIKSALKIASKDDVWVSTDSERYADIAKKYGATVPFIRPDYLAEDNANSIDVVFHAMKFATQQQYEYDAVGLLEPTSPFVKAETLERAVNILFTDENADCIVAVRESRPNRKFIQFDTPYLEEISENISKMVSVGRQALETEITPSGGFYIAKWECLLKNKSFYTQRTRTYKVDVFEELEIDEPIDFLWAEFLLENQDKLSDK